MLYIQRLKGKIEYGHSIVNLQKNDVELVASQAQMEFTGENSIIMEEWIY